MLLNDTNMHHVEIASFIIEICSASSIDFVNSAANYLFINLLNCLGFED